MAMLLAAKRGNKPKLRSQKEMRALAYFHFANDEFQPLGRLQKLWQCFQLFEELKLCKNGRLLEVKRYNLPTTTCCLM